MQAIRKTRTVDEYIGAITGPARRPIIELRATVRKLAPQAEEVISYNMPAFRMHGMLVWYAACKNHIGFYPTPSAIVAFKKQLSSYECSKGAIQFSLDRPLPVALIEDIVRFRIEENVRKEKIKRSQKKAKTE